MEESQPLAHTEWEDETAPNTTIANSAGTQDGQDSAEADLTLFHLSSTEALCLSVLSLRLGTFNAKGLVRPGRQAEIGHLATRLTLDILAVQETHCKENSARKIDIENQSYTLVLSSHMDCRQEGREHHGVGIILKSLLLPYVLCLYQGSSRLTGILLDTHPLPLLILSCYAPTAAHPIAEKELFYNKVREVLTENPNARLVERTPQDYGIGDNIFPSPYRFADMPEDSFENRSLFLDLLAANSLTAVNTTHLGPPEQQVTYRAPGGYTVFC